MKKGLLLSFVVLLCGLQAVAQSFSVSGKVTYADDGSPVIGATVTVKGMPSVGSLTDVNGVYKIAIPASVEPKVLVCKYVGMDAQEKEVGQSGQVIDFALVADAQDIETVIVTGYGNFTRKDYTGSAATVNTSVTKDVPTVSVSSRLVGTVPGLSITSTSGQPGAVESVRIRGMGSVNAGNEPLYVVDGVPVFQGDASNFTYSKAGNSILASINPSDIENITVIKDAAAASLYGSRAANGVIIITTKRGKSGKTQFNVKASLGFTDMASDWRPVLDGDATVALFELGLKNLAQYKGVSGKKYSEAEAIAYGKANIDSYYTKPWSGWTNWRDYLLSTGVAQQYEVSASGGNDKTRFYSSLSYNDTKGITLNSDYKRITGRLNVNHKAGIFSLDAGMMYSNTEQSSSSEGTSFSSPMMSIAIALSPADYPYNEDGTINTTKGFPFAGRSLANPLQSAKYNYDKSTVNRVMANVSGKLDFTKALSLKEVLSYDLISSNNRVWWDPRTNDGQSANGVYQRYKNDRSTLTSQTQLNYTNTFGGKHNVSALASFELEKYAFDLLGASGQNYPSPLLPEISNAATKSGSSYLQGSSLISYVVDANYNYDSRLFFKASYRRDGSSRLSNETRWGNFWAVSGSWRVANESWFKNGGISNVMSDLKVRASYGVNGTQPSGYYDYMGLYGFGYNYAGAPGAIETALANPYLTWESNESANIGIDFGFANKLNISVDLYERTTKDLILARPISLTTGFKDFNSNVGSLRNRGIEVDIRYNPITTPDWNWTIGLNFSHNENKVIALADGQKEIQSGRWVHRLNNPYYSFNLFEYAGVDPATGKEQYYTNTPDADGNIIDRTITTDATKVHKAIVGRWDPVISGGLTSSLSWKGIDLNFTFSYSFGGQAIDNMAVNYSNGSNWATDAIAIPSYYNIDKMWKKPGDVAELPMYAYGGNGNEYTSNRFLKSTDHLRLKNLTLGYAFPKKWMNSIGMQKIRVYVSGNNLFTVKDKDMYMDPETPIGGLVSFDTPQLRTVSFGIEFGF